MSPSCGLIDPDEPSAHLVRARDGGQHTSDLFAEDDVRSPLLDGFAVRLGDLTHR